MASESATPGSAIPCPSCGHQNAAWRYLCERCNVTLASTVRDVAAAREMASAAPLDRNRPRGRPGCVTFYVILMWLGAALGALAAILLPAATPQMMRYLAAEMPPQLPRWLITAIIGLALGFAVFQFVLGLGLWRMKNWARIVLLLFTGLGLLGNIVQLATRLSARAQNPQVIGVVVSLAVGSLIFYWFAANGHRFD